MPYENVPDDAKKESAGIACQPKASGADLVTVAEFTSCYCGFDSRRVQNL